MTRFAKYFLGFFALTFGMSACQDAGPGVEQTGSEMMPDMYHSTAYEAMVQSDYELNRFDNSVIAYENAAQNRRGVEGTIPRGFAGVALAPTQEARQEIVEAMNGEADGAIATPMNTQVPYYYDDTEEERERARQEIVGNPYPITTKGLEKGKNLYNIYCAICHGEKGDGNGWLVAEENPNAAYPVIPANFLVDPHVDNNNGHYYHAIMYGKNVMGAYKDKLDYEERWQVIHWIRNLQAKELKLVYTQDENTFNEAYGAPGGKVPTIMALNNPDADPDADGSLDNPTLQNEAENAREVAEEVLEGEGERR